LRRAGGAWRIPVYATLVFLLVTAPSIAQTAISSESLFQTRSNLVERNDLALIPTPPGLPQWQLWKINADGTGLAQFAATPGYSCGSAQWSPDGTLVAFDLRRVDEPLTASQVAVIRADGSGLRLLGPGSMPSFSPDGTHLVIHTYDSPQTIVVMNVDGTGRETILDHWGSPRWLRRGNRIAVIGADRGLALFDLATGTERKIFGPRSMMAGFAFAPDGRQFCFGESSGGVWLGTLDERTMRAKVQQIVPTGKFYHAAWSPDGKRIVFARSGPGTTWVTTTETAALNEFFIFDANSGVATVPETRAFHQLFIFDVDSGAPPVLLAGQNTERSNTNPAWSPGGKTIIFSSLIPWQMPTGKSP
jgi:Tol biopolymer transport system component